MAAAERYQTAGARLAGDGHSDTQGGSWLEGLAAVEPGASLAPEPAHPYSFVT